MLCTRYSGGISQLQLKPGRIHLLPKILSLAGKQGQKAWITSSLDKQSFFHGSDSQKKHDDVLTHESHLCTTKQWWKGGWCKVFSNSHPKYKESVQKLDAKSRNSPGQCLGITKGLRTTGDYVASHKVSHQRTGLFPAAGRSEQPVSPWQRFGDPLKTRKGPGRAESGCRAPADHEHAPLQLPQVDPHLGAVAGFPHPDLQERKGKKECSREIN